jgi:hypothetical protein
VGSHAKHSRKSPIVRSDASGSWTRKYPAITVAALAGTVVGAPGGVAAAMTIGGHSPHTSPNPATADIVPAKANAEAADASLTNAATNRPTPAPTASSVKISASAKTKAKASASASASASTSASASASASATTAKATPTATSTNPYASVSWGTLEPVAFYGSQNTFTPTSDQWENARTIVNVAEQRGMPLYAAVIAVATSIQESQLINLTTATNADSVGLFQQRPSQGWGTYDELIDPSFAANAFLAALDEDAPDYDSIYLWEAAQDVQRSGYPTAYAQWQSQATTMVYDIVNGQAPS